VRLAEGEYAVVEDQVLAAGEVLEPEGGMSVQGIDFLPGRAGNQTGPDAVIALRTDGGQQGQQKEKYEYAS
jgi:hypothetical protein